MLDTKTEGAVSEVISKLRELLGERLVSAALYGSAAGADFVPGVSDVNLIVVIDAINAGDLLAVRPHVARWRKRKIATPLLVDRTFLRDAADVFPMEFLDIKQQHRLLCGENLFAVLEVHGDHLRYQCEHEARGKLLRLREVFLEIRGGHPQLRSLMLDSLKTFLIIMRNANRLCGLPAGDSFESVLQTFSQQFQTTFSVMERLLQVKLGRREWHGDDEAAFGDYLAEVQQLVSLIDQIPLQAAATDATI